MSEYPLVSVIICHWNAGVRTSRCIRQFQAWSYPLDRLNVIVQDNASNDGSSNILEADIESLAKAGLAIRYNRLPAHPGLTKSVNMALEEIPLSIPYVMRLDNDVELAGDGLTVMVRYLEQHPRVGVVGPRIVYASDPAQLNAAAIWINPWGGKNRMEDTTYPTECDTLLGAVMLARRQSLAKLGRWFDPALYLFAEEDESCWQLREAGFGTHYVPSALAFHDTAQSTGKHSLLSTYLSYRNRIVVFDRMTSWPVSVLRNLNLLPRILVHCLRQHSWIPLYGFIDGLLEKPLNDMWWQQQITSAEFHRPP